MARKAEVAKLDCKRIRDLVPPCHQNVGGFKSLWVKFLPWRYVSAENACFAIERIPFRVRHLSSLAWMCAYKSFTASSMRIQICPLNRVKES